MEVKVVLGEKLYEIGFIGAYPDGIGYGNVSMRTKNNEFVISGSATGNFQSLHKEHYALVYDFDIEKNTIYSKGQTKASSESLSHAAIYSSNPNINGIIHIHNTNMWEKYLGVLPTTDKNASFGTPEIAQEIKKYSQKDSGIIIMGGHKEGIITFGNTLEQALTILKKATLYLTKAICLTS